MKPHFAITEQHDHGDYHSVSIDTAEATYQGFAWRALGDFGKRKFENFLVISFAPQRLKIRYV